MVRNPPLKRMIKKIFLLVFNRDFQITWNDVRTSSH